MSYALFHCALFRLADTWTVSTQLNDYILFLKDLYFALVTPTRIVGAGASLAAASAAAAGSAAASAESGAAGARPAPDLIEWSWKPLPYPYSELLRKLRAEAEARSGMKPRLVAATTTAPPLPGAVPSLSRGLSFGGSGAGSAPGTAESGAGSRSMSPTHGLRSPSASSTSSSSADLTPARTTLTPSKPGFGSAAPRRLLLTNDSSYHAPESTLSATAPASVLSAATVRGPNSARNSRPPSNQSLSNTLALPASVSRRRRSQLTRSRGSTASASPAAAGAGTSSSLLGHTASDRHRQRLTQMNTAIQAVLAANESGAVSSAMSPRQQRRVAAADPCASNMKLSLAMLDAFGEHEHNDVKRSEFVIGGGSNTASAATTPKSVTPSHGSARRRSLGGPLTPGGGGGGGAARSMVAAAGSPTHHQPQSSGSGESTRLYQPWKGSGRAKPVR
jgi:hypothetical protein